MLMDGTIAADDFPEKASRPDWFWTWVFRVFIFGLPGIMVVCIFMIPAAFALDGYYGDEPATNIVVLTVSYALLLWFSWLLARYFKSQRKHAVVTVRVDRQGVHYRYADGRSDSLLYTDLQRSNVRYTPDVFAKTQRRGPTLLRVFVQGSPRTVTFMTDIGYGYYTGNQRELLAHFIRGIQLFSRNLHVDSTVFSKFFIDPDTYVFDKKEWVKTAVTVVIILFLMLVLMEWYMKYRFGASLFF